MVLNNEIILYGIANNVPNRYDGYIDLSPMQTGDTIEVRVYVKINLTGIYIQYNIDTYTDSQTPNYLVYIPTLPSDLGWEITAKQTAGTVRTLDWRFYGVV